MVAGHDTSPIHERIDRSCELLQNAYRRRVIYALQKRGPATANELADAVVSAGLADDRRQVLTSLVHTHLPKLAAAEVVEYEGPDDVVSLSEGVEALEPFLSVAAREEDDREQPSAFDAGTSIVVTTGSE